MRYTTFPGMHLSRLPPSTRVLLTLFVLTIDLGMVIGSLKYTQRADFTPAGAEGYYHGQPEGLAGEELLAGEEPLDSHPERKSTRYLVDAVHPHVFTVPVLLFILFHLLALTRLSERTKILLDLHAFLSAAATFGLPFLVAATGRGAALFVVAGANLLASFALVSAILLFATWWPRQPLPATGAFSGPRGSGDPPPAGGDPRPAAPDPR